MEDWKELQETATMFFKDLFISDGVEDPLQIMSEIQSCISQEDNSMLNATYSAAEIYSAVKMMGATKAPGWDGLSTLFFQMYWHAVGANVVHFCLGILNDGKDLGRANLTEIVLLPKRL